nr:hypothetical protein [Allomuricauda sp.]
MESYVIEIVTFRYKPNIKPQDFWKEDARIQENYTSKQPGFISRESAYSEDSKEVLVVVRWRTIEDADTSMQKFMKDRSVSTFSNMIDAKTMKMIRYNSKN